MTDPVHACKLSKRIQETVASTIEHEIKDRRLEFVTITDCRVTGDLRDVTVFYTVHGRALDGEPDYESTAAALEKAKGQLRSLVGRGTGVRYTPTLAFEVDMMPEISAHLEELLGKTRACDAKLAERIRNAKPAGDVSPYRDEEQNSPPATPVDERGTHVITSSQAREQAAHQLSRAINRRVSKPIQRMQDIPADAKKVGIATRVRSDVDAIGAASATVMTLVQRGISAVASYGESDLPAKSLLTIPGWERFVKYMDLDEDIDTWVTIDCAGPGRLDAPGGRMMASDRVINIDHHATNTCFGAVSTVDELVESSTMVLLGFFGIWNIKLTTPTAHTLYVGLLTDTASFQFGRSRMHTTATRLLDRGLDLRTIDARLLGEHPFAYLPFLSKVLSTATSVPGRGDGAGPIHVVIEHDRATGVGHDEIELVTDIVHMTSAADVCAVLREYEPSQWMVSLRSRELVGISQVALEIDGGDRERAAGLTCGCSKDELLQALLDTSDIAAQVRRGTGEAQGIVGLAKNQEAHRD